MCIIRLNKCRGMMILEMRIYCLLLFFALVINGNSLRIPENPCPDIFSYYKKQSNDEVYGEVNIPYDGKNNLEFSVNASMVGYYKKADLNIQLVTPLKQIVNGPKLKYNVFFPFTNVVPKITQIVYNGRIFCSGPPEPLIPGTPGVTNVWANHIYSYSTFLSREKDNSDNAISHSEDNGTSDSDIPVKEPGTAVSSSETNIRPNINLNPFLNPAVDSGFVSATTKSPNDDQKCGIANNLIVPLIVGGTEIEEGQFPWLTAMFAYNSRNKVYEYRCTANLISNKHVITAARCVQYFKVQIIKTEDILFVLGKSDLAHWATNGAITRGASNVQTHPSFKENSALLSAHGDVTVITLDKPVTFSSSIRPVCLWDESDELEPLVNKMGSLASWGEDESSEGSDDSGTLKAKRVELPIVSQFECLKSDVVFRNLTSEMTFCAGEKNGKGPCVGDSGAGFVVPKQRIFYLRGIVSIATSTNGSCNLNKYVVFCDVAKFGKWIKSCMRN